MKQLFFVTENLHEFEEVKTMMINEGITLLKSDAKIIEQKLKTEKEVSLAKAYHAMKIISKPLIVEDTGIYFEAYNNFPGPNAAVFYEGVGIPGILKILENKNRKAYFRTVFTFYKPGEMPMTFEGVCKGTMRENPSENVSFAYDTLFMPEGETRTFSEMSKEQHSHRAKAVRALLDWLKVQDF